MQSCRRSPLMTLTVTGPLARTEAQRMQAVVKRPISPTNCPSVLSATSDSRGPRASVSVKSLALEAPWEHQVSHQCPGQHSQHAVPSPAHGPVAEQTIPSIAGMRGNAQRLNALMDSGCCSRLAARLPLEIIFERESIQRPSQRSQRQPNCRALLTMVMTSALRV